jgi:hypothetical protein
MRAMITLRRGRVLRLPDRAGSTITAHTGAVWITEEDNLRDVVLRQGESLKLARPGLILVEALADASISFD